MSLESRIESLSEKVNHLDGQIHEAYVHHLPTQDMKKQRLQFLDAIRQLKLTYNREDAA